MPINFDTQWFLIVFILMVVVGLPRITSRVSLPAQLKFLEVSTSQLTPKQADFFRASDAKLDPLGFFPLTTFRVANLSGANLSRVYTSSSDPARIIVTLMSSADGKISHNYVEINSKYQKGTLLTTKNSGASTVFARMPNHIVQKYQEMQDFEELKRRHDEKASTLTSYGVVYRDNKAFFSDFADYHKRFCEFQQTKKFLRYDPSAGVYRATVRTGLRGIQNYLNPLADNFTVPRFATVTLFSSALPFLVLIRLSLIVDWLHFRFGFDPATASAVLPGVAFTLGGAIVGYLFKQKSFIWAFLLGYIPTRLIGATPQREFWFCLWMGMVADLISRWRMWREKLV